MDSTGILWVWKGIFGIFIFEVDRLCSGPVMGFLGPIPISFRYRPNLKDQSPSKWALSWVSKVEPGFLSGLTGSILFHGFFSRNVALVFWSRQPLPVLLGLVGLL
jgi:hypothetical protein